ncbi:hypothetical protein FN846DRAFT_894158 [Sphaerosporella brunnea]|uniref:Uncharacterized protein n=1 Tax=Sphaerosporella brunnea TaxID=1250544 RepID=A0A5J5EKC0_9PEZI|nr:hypothetical protein FN846DRAFT_894158 [Sphaerosporella brunnea]
MVRLSDDNGTADSDVSSDGHGSYEDGSRSRSPNSPSSTSDSGAVAQLPYMYQNHMPEFRGSALDTKLSERLVGCFDDVEAMMKVWACTDGGANLSNASKKKLVKALGEITRERLTDLAGKVKEMEDTVHTMGLLVQAHVQELRVPDCEAGELMDIIMDSERQIRVYISGLTAAEKTPHALLLALVSFDPYFVASQPKHPHLSSQYRALLARASILSNNYDSYAGQVKEAITDYLLPVSHRFLNRVTVEKHFPYFPRICMLVRSMWRMLQAPVPFSKEKLRSKANVFASLLEALISNRTMVPRTGFWELCALVVLLSPLVLAMRFKARVADGDEEVFIKIIELLDDLKKSVVGSKRRLEMKAWVQVRGKARVVEIVEKRRDHAPVETPAAMDTPAPLETPVTPEPAKPKHFATRRQKKKLAAAARKEAGDDGSPTMATTAATPSKSPEQSPSSSPPKRRWTKKKAAAAAGPKETEARGAPAASTTPSPKKGGNTTPSKSSAKGKSPDTTPTPNNGGSGKKKWRSKTNITATNSNSNSNNNNTNTNTNKV